MHKSIDNKLAQFVNGFCTDQVPLKVIYLVFFANLATKVASKVIYFILFANINEQGAIKGYLLCFLCKF